MSALRAARLATVASSRLVGQSVQPAFIAASFREVHNVSAVHEGVTLAESKLDTAKAASGKGMTITPSVSNSVCTEAFIKDSIMAEELLGNERATLSLADLQKVVWGVEYLSPWKPSKHA